MQIMASMLAKRSPVMRRSLPIAEFGRRRWPQRCSYYTFAFTESFGVFNAQAQTQAQAQVQARATHTCAQTHIRVLHYARKSARLPHSASGGLLRAHPILHRCSAASVSRGIAQRHAHRQRRRALATGRFAQAAEGLPGGLRTAIGAPAGRNRYVKSRQANERQEEDHGYDRRCNGR